MNPVFALAMLAVQSLLVPNVSGVSATAGAAALRGPVRSQEVLKGVVRRAGVAAPGCRLMIQGGSGVTATTDAEGAFELPHGGREPVWLDVYGAASAGYSLMGSIEAQPPLGPLELDLMPHSLNVEVRWPNGNLGWAKQIEVVPASQGAHHMRTVSWGVTGVKGRATLWLPAPGDYWVTVYDVIDAQVQALVRIEPRSSCRTVLTLEPEVACQGELRLPAPPDRWSRGTLIVEPLDAWLGPCAPRQREGSVETGQTSFEVLGMKPGYYRACFRTRRGPILESAPFTVPKGGSKDLVLRFDRGSR